MKRKKIEMKIAERHLTKKNEKKEMKILVSNVQDLQLLGNENDKKMQDFSFIFKNKNHLRKMNENRLMRKFAEKK